MSEHVCVIADPSKLKIHPVADLFPRMGEKEFQALVEDLRKNGLLEPIKLDKTGEWILDGRHRHQGCPLAGVEPRYVARDGESSDVEYVLSLNLHRRHMNESQRAMVAAKIRETMSLGEVGANLRPGRSANRAGFMLNVSARSVLAASKVLRSGREKLIADVQSGKLSVSAAARQLRDPAAPKTEAAPPEPGRFLVRFGEDHGVMLLWAPASTLAATARLIERRGLGVPLGEPADEPPPAA